jgi:RNA polymerase sigma-70 factor (ECF subfamily)
MSVNLAEIIEGCKKGRPKYQKALYDIYAPKFMGVCYRYALGVQEAEDMMHDGFVIIFTKIDTYSGLGSFEGWMRRIMVNNAINHIKKKDALKFSYEPDWVSDINITDDSVLDRIQYKELIDLVKTLPSGYQMVFNLYAIEGYSHKEIAEKLGISESTSKSQYHMAKMKLKEVIYQIEKIELSCQAVLKTS